VTKGAQWVRVHAQIELLDTPGILPAFAYSGEVARKLALFNLLPEALYDNEEIAEHGLEQIKTQYPQLLRSYIPDTPEAVTLEQIASCRNLIASGGKLDRLRAANVFLSDIRSGKLGRVTLDRP
jgi:ribosome biogenesis GTPase A